MPEVEKMSAQGGWSEKGQVYGAWYGAGADPHLLPSGAGVVSFLMGTCLVGPCNWALVDPSRSSWRSIRADGQTTPEGPGSLIPKDAKDNISEPEARV